MKKLLIYIMVLFLISVPMIANAQKNIDAVKQTEMRIPQIVTEPLKRSINIYPIQHIPEPQTEQETVLEEPTEVYMGKFELTAYCSCKKCCGKYALNRPKDENGNEVVFGSIGQRLYQGVSVAVDPSVIPYGSRVLIGDKEYFAHDCGGDIKGNRIDVYFDNHSDAKEFGRQWQDVYLLAS